MKICWACAAVAWCGVLAPLDVAADSSILQVHGSGTTNPSLCYWKVMEEFMTRSQHPIRLTYRAVGSTTGQTEFINQYNVNESAADFGSGDIPLNATTYQGFTNAGISVAHFPVLIGAVALFHNVPNVPDLNLTGCVVARIMKRDITVWNHPDIAALNPNLPANNLPAITVVHRLDGSSSTSSVTAYLNKVCPDEWPSDLVGATIEWPEDTLGCEGSGGVTECIEDTPGTIGYIEAGHGVKAGLTEIDLENADGNLLNSQVAARNDGIAEAANVPGMLPTTADADFSSVSLLNQPGTYTWPIVLMTYIYVRTDLTFITDPNEQTLLLAFLQALYDDNYVQACVDEFGFTLPSPAVRDTFVGEIDRLLQVSSNATTWTFEVDTAPLTATGDYVISNKRQQISDIERATALENIDELQGTVAMLTSELASTDRRLVALTQAVQDSGIVVDGSSMEQREYAGDGAFGDSEETQLKAALALSVISFVMSFALMALFMMRWFSQPKVVTNDSVVGDNTEGAPSDL